MLNYFDSLRAEHEIWNTGGKILKLMHLWCYVIFMRFFFFTLTFFGGGGVFNCFFNWFFFLILIHIYIYFDFGVKYDLDIFLSDILNIAFITCLSGSVMPFIQHLLQTGFISDESSAPLFLQEQHHQFPFWVQSEQHFRAIELHTHVLAIRSPRQAIWRSWWGTEKLRDGPITHKTIHSWVSADLSALKNNHMCFYITLTQQNKLNNFVNFISCTRFNSFFKPV